GFEPATARELDLTDLQRAAYRVHLHEIWEERAVAATILVREWGFPEAVTVANPGAPPLCTGNSVTSEDLGSPGSEDDSPALGAPPEDSHHAVVTACSERDPGSGYVILLEAQPIESPMD